jgi:hypothetical protein
MQAMQQIVFDAKNIMAEGSLGLRAQERQKQIFHQETPTLLRSTHWSKLRPTSVLSTYFYKLFRVCSSFSLQPLPQRVQV